MIQDFDFARLEVFVYDQSWKQTILTRKKEKRQTLKLNSSKLAHVKTMVVLPWLTKLHCETSVFKCGLPFMCGAVAPVSYFPSTTNNELFFLFNTSSHVVRRTWTSTWT